MKKRLLLLVLITNSLFAMSIDEVEPYKQMLAKCDKNLEIFIEKNQLKYQKDADFHRLMLSYTFECQSPKINTIVKEPDTSKKIIGYFDTLIDTEKFKKAVKVYKSNRKYFRNRLDLFEGVISMAIAYKEWDIVKENLIIMIKESKRNNNQWLDMYSKPLPISSKQLLKSIQGFLYKIFKTETNTTDKICRDVGMILIELYPNSVYGYANVGTFYLINKNYTQAKKYYQNGLKIAPSDSVIKYNLDYIKKLESKKSK